MTSTEDRVEHLTQMLEDCKQKQIELIDELTTAYKRESALLNRIAQLESKNPDSPYMRLKRSYWRLRKKAANLTGKSRRDS